MWGTKIVGALSIFAAVLSTTAALCALPGVMGESISLANCQYLTFTLFNAVLTAAIAWLFSHFIWDIGKNSEIFTRDQSERLISLAFLNLCMFLVRLIAPTVDSLGSPVSWFQPAAVHPEIDLQLLMFAAMFFALAGVFEYGRMLKKDSDSIV
ncbi:hypothetical protein QUW00_03930 [Collinsella tanakaei]|nr:hypothetical protein [Collinsella tanakaei]